MDAEKAVAAAEAEGRREEEVESLLNKVWRYSLFLYFGIMIAAIAPASNSSPAAGAIPSLPACYDLRYRLTAILYSLFLYVGSVIVAIAPRLAPASRPAVVPSLPVTCAAFTVATLVVQETLARVLERRPAPVPRLTPQAAWPLGISTWMFFTMFFHSYLSFGGDDYFVRSCDEWQAACVASSLNLFIATLTVSDYLLA